MGTSVKGCCAKCLFDTTDSVKGILLPGAPAFPTYPPRATLPCMPTQKLYCYVDETGKDTLGQLFVVSVVTAKEDRAALSTAPRRKGVDLSGVFARMHRCARSTAGSARPPPSRALPAGQSARSNTFHLILDISQDCRPTPDLLPSQANSTPLLRGAVLRKSTPRWKPSGCERTEGKMKLVG